MLDRIAIIFKNIVILPKHFTLLRPIYSMKYLLITMALLAAVLPGCISQDAGRENNAGASPDAGATTDSATGEAIDSIMGEAIGSAAGFRGIIRVRVRMDRGVITEITVIESHEDRAVGGAAIEELTDLVLMYNSTDVDAISGATESSKGFLAAVEHAILSQ